jgi:hypothetical protein
MVANILLCLFGLGFAVAVWDIIREGYRNEKDFRDFLRRDRDRWKF